MNEKFLGMALNYIMKKGMVYEGKNLNVDLEIPKGALGEKVIKVNCKVDHMTVTLKE